MNYSYIYSQMNKLVDEIKHDWTCHTCITHVAPEFTLGS